MTGGNPGTRVRKPMRIATRGAAAAVLVVAACASPNPDPTTIAMTITATESINPNSASEPSPVVLRIYQLGSDGAFHASEFADIFYDDGKVLGGDLLGRKELDLKPGAEVTYDGTISGQTRYVGVVAGFRNIGSATWRVIVPVVPETENRLILNVDTLSVAVRRPKSRLWSLF